MKRKIFVSSVDELNLISFKKNIFHNFLQGQDKIITTRSIRIDKDENIYVIENNSVLKIAKNSTPKILYKRNTIERFLWNLEISNDSILWFSGTENKLHRYHLKTQKEDIYELPFKQTTLDDDIICQSMHNYNEEEILMGGNFGLVIFNKQHKTFKRYNQQFDIQQYFIKDIIYSNYELWIATQYNGLFYFNEKTKEQKHYHSESAPYRLTENNLYDIHLSDVGEIWIGSVKGVDVLNPSTHEIKHYGIEDGLSDPRVVGIIETSNDFWMGTFNGLMRLSKETNLFSKYDASDGLAIKEFNQKSFYKHNDSTLLFGGINGFIKFNPYRIEKKSTDISIKLIKALFYESTFDSIVQHQYSINKIEEINVPYNKNYVSLTFGNIGGKENKVRYKILGLHPSWLIANREGEINLISLPEGTHTLLVKSANSNESLENNALKYTINVEKPFFKKLWVQIIFFSFLSILGIGYYFIYKNKIINEKLYASQIRQLHDKAYKAQMNPHFTFNVINNLQSAFLLKGEEFVNEYISSFAKLLRATLDNSEKEKITLKEEIEYLKAYLKLFELRNIDILISFEVDHKLNINLIKIPPMLFQPLIENAIIHGLTTKKGKKELKIAFRKYEDSLVGIIRDNGVGISNTNKIHVEGYKSYGNMILNERLKIYNKVLAPKKIELNVESLQNETGTQVTLVIPV